MLNAFHYILALLYSSDKGSLGHIEFIFSFDRLKFLWFIQTNFICITKKKQQREQKSIVIPLSDHAV